MFKNCVLKADVNTIKWAKAAGIRAIKTMAQAAIGAIGAAVTLGAVDWHIVGSTAVLAGVVSLLTSVVGLPEVEGVKSKGDELT